MLDTKREHDKERIRDFQIEKMFGDAKVQAKDDRDSSSSSYT